MASTKYVQNNTRTNQPRKGKDEFFLHKKDIELVQKFREKIEKLYNIKITSDNETEDGQWINILGEHVDRRNAKVVVMFSYYLCTEIHVGFG